MLTPERFWTAVQALTEIVKHPAGDSWDQFNPSVRTVVVAGYQHYPVRAQFADISQAVLWAQRMRYLGVIFGPVTALEVGMMVTLEQLGEFAARPETLDPRAVQARWEQVSSGECLGAEASRAASIPAQRAQ